MKSIKIWRTRYFLVYVFYSVLLVLGGGCGTLSLTPPPEPSSVATEEGSAVFGVAQRFFDSGQFRKAIELWEQIPPTDPQYVDAQFAIRKARLRIKQIGEEQAVSLETGSQLDTYIVQAEQLERQGKFREALQLYEEARLLMPQNTLLYKKIEDLHALLEDAIERHKSLGELYFARGEYEKSKAEWERLLLIEPSNEQAKQRLGDLEVLTATSDRVFYQRGNSLIRKGLLNRAHAEFEKALRINPENERTLQAVSHLESIPFTEYTVKKGDTLSSIAKQYTQDASDFTILADFNKLEPKVSLIIGQTLKIPHVLRFRQALAPEEEELFTENMAQEPLDASRSLNPPQESEEGTSTAQLLEQGVVAYNQGNYRKAMKLFNTVYERDPDNQEAYDYFILATTNLRQGTPAVEASPEMFTENQETGQTTEIEALIQAGIALRNVGKLKDAVTTFEKASQLDPENNEIDEYLEETRDEFQKLMTSHLNEGIKLFNQANLEGAIKEWEKVLDLDPSNPQATEYKKRAESMLQALEPEDE